MSQYRDAAGQKVDFKEPYFDKALRRSFKSAEEKSNFMRARNICQNGDSDSKAHRQRKEYHEMKMDTDREYRRKHEGR